MRWLFLFLLSLNLAYVALEMRESSTVVDVPALKSAQRIVLLRELKQQPSNLAAVEQMVDGVEAADAEISTLAEQVAVIEDSPAQAAVVSPQVVENKSEVVQQPEHVVAKAVTSVEPTVPVQKPPLETSQSISCFTLGPFRDLAKLRGLTREIKSYVIEADFRGREEKERTIFWVYLKPEKNRSQAITTGKRLKAKKIKDFYVIRDGEKINGLSLGHFRSKKGAYALAKKVKNLGFNVVVEPVYRSHTIYWLDYQLAAGVAIPESIFEKYIQSAKKQKVSRLSRECSA